MNAVIPERTIEAAPAWVLYDGDCAFCREGARWFQNVLERHGFKLAPLQTPWVRARLGLEAGAVPEEMIVLLPDGQVWGGADGIMQMTRQMWWAWPLYLISRLPGMMILFRAIYRWVAARRYCLNGACAVRGGHIAYGLRRKLNDWLPLAVLTLTAFMAGDFVPAWAWMWLLALAIFFGFKWLMWRRAMCQVEQVSVWRSLGYLFGWVGMDADRFLRREKVAVTVRWQEWIGPTLKLLGGTVLVWGVARQLVAMHPLLAGWTGMLGIILCLHFGLFELLALVWRLVGVEAKPLMRQPLYSTSLAEFWGQRWNSAFNRLANDLVFRPLLPKVGPAGAVLAVFGLSGVIHDLLISLPARGGYGLPTLYFLVQALGLIFERSEFARWLGLGHGWRGWLFVFLMAAMPAYWLFHPIFVRNVILPMLHAIGAT